MAAIRNSADKILQAATTRTTNLAGARVRLTAPTNTFHVNAAGVADPASITVNADLTDLEGTITFSASGGTLTSITANSAALTYANKSAQTAIITASVTVNGQTYSDMCFITTVLDGAKGDVGANGPRGAGNFYVVGSSWSDIAADIATPGATVLDDQVTIADGTVTYTKRWNGSAWVVPGAYLAGSLFVENSITAAKINTNGLVVRATDGTPIVGIGVPLDPAYAAPGTLNSALTASINSAATTAQWSNIAGQANAPASNATNDLTLNQYGVTIQGNTLTKTGGVAESWDASAWSPQGYQAAFVSAMPMNYANYAIGLDVEPTANYHISTIDYGIYFRENGEVWYAESGNYGAMTIPTTYVPGQDIYTIDYDGAAFRYRKNQTVIRIVVVAIAAPLFFDSSFFTAGASLGKVQFGLLSSVADRLSKNAADILSGPIALQAGGAIVAGTLTFDASGNRTGGSGTAQTSKGWVGHNGTRPTIIVDATTGKAKFSDEVAIGATDYNTDPGIWLGFVGANPKMSIRTANGSTFLCDPGNNVMVMNGSTITNPTFDAFSATGTMYADVYGPNGTLSASFSAAGSGGGGSGFSYLWSFSQTGGPQISFTSSSITEPSFSFSCVGSNRTVTGIVACTVNDLKTGRSVHRTGTFTFTFGTV